MIFIRILFIIFHAQKVFGKSPFFFVASGLGQFLNDQFFFLLKDYPSPFSRLKLLF